MHMSARPVLAQPAAATAKFNPCCYMCCCCCCCCCLPDCQFDAFAFYIQVFYSEVDTCTEQQGTYELIFKIHADHIHCLSNDSVPSGNTSAASIVNLTFHRVQKLAVAYCLGTLCCCCWPTYCPVPAAAIPMVDVVTSSKRSAVKRISRQLLPTAESPTSSTCVHACPELCIR
jgi:hypothetical protein